MNEAGLRLAAQQWQQEGRPAVVVTVRRTQGSVPREAGVRMVVDAQGQLGTIGGGHLEWQALQTARRLIAQGKPGAQGAQGAQADRIERHALGPRLGQCCGGVVELGYQALDERALADWPPPPALFHLCLYGAGHVGWAVARLLIDLDARLDWIDTREDALPDPTHPQWARAPHIRLIASEAPTVEARHSPPRALHLVMTHSHALDFDLVEALLHRPEVPWVGLIGSKTKRQRFEHRLLARGLPPQRLQDLHCPVGWPGLDSKAPAVIAVAVVGQVLAWALGPGGPSNRTDVARSQHPDPQER